jgi:hypothetical protein
MSWSRARDASSHSPTTTGATAWVLAWSLAGILAGILAWFRAWAAAWFRAWAVAWAVAWAAAWFRAWAVAWAVAWAAAFPRGGSVPQNGYADTRRAAPALRAVEHAVRTLSIYQHLAYRPVTLRFVGGARTRYRSCIAQTRLCSRQHRSSRQVHRVGIWCLLTVPDAHDSQTAVQHHPRGGEDRDGHSP